MLSLDAVHVMGPSGCMQAAEAALTGRHAHMNSWSLQQLQADAHRLHAHQQGLVSHAGLMQ